MKTMLCAMTLAAAVLVSAAVAQCPSGCPKKEKESSCKSESCGCTNDTKKADCKCAPCACGKKGSDEKGEKAGCCPKK
jgi:hypothetical protein